MEELHLIAVYGDLRKGCSSHNEILKHQTHIGDFDSEPSYSMYSFGLFPALLNYGNTSIKMEVYAVTDNVLNRINQLQKYEKGREIDNLYDLDTIETPYGEARIYYYNQHVAGKPMIESGDWVTFKEGIKHEMKLSKYGQE